jgi:hypothetical protein
MGLSCKAQTEARIMKETLLTTGTYGHTLNSAQVFSPDDQWIVYDTRNDDTHISRTGSIEKVNVVTGEIVKVYTTDNQTVHGPGVGAVAFHPRENKMIFIHGLQNCDSIRPYGFTRRFGAVWKENAAGIHHAEARTIKDPLVPGALRGGTHAHTWSGDGEWISFTYNDYLMELREKSTNGVVKDLRTIGVMAPLKNVTVSRENEEEFSGEYFSVVAAAVTEKPSPGSDEIERAFDECWIGTNGYIKADGTRQKRAIAFQGHVRNADGALVTEVFIADIPDNITEATHGKPLEGTEETRPNVPKGLIQRRVTFTTGRKHAGMQGPRFRLRTSPDGREVYFLMKDDADVVQIFSVPTAGGKAQQVTRLKNSIQAQFNVRPDGSKLSCIADNSVWIIDLVTGKATRITARAGDQDAPVNGALWSHSGKMLAFNRYVAAGNDRYLQIIGLDLE